jgi:hypothetical protein
VRVNDDSGGSRQEDPVIVVSSTGEAIAIWRDDRKNKTHIYSAFLPADGAAWSANVRVSEVQTSYKEDPHLAIDSNGLAYAVFVDTRSGSREIWMATRANGASSWSTNTQISDAAEGIEWHPEIGVDSVGSLTVVWERSFDSQTSREIRARHRAAGSATWGAIEVIGPGGVSPSVAVRPDGRAYAAWGSSGVFGAEYDPLSGSWSAPEQVNDVSSDQMWDAAVAVDSSAVLVLWTGGSFPDNDIRARLKLD